MKLGRRGFLGGLAAAPVAAPEAVKAAMEPTTGIGWGGPMLWDDIDPNREASSKLRNLLYDLEYERTNGNNISEYTVPYDIATKKSWSPAFKDRAMRGRIADARRVQREINKLHEQINSGSLLDKGALLVKFARIVG